MDIKKHPYKRIVRSCITGQVVWIYRGASYEASRVAYWRACQKEIARVKAWPSYVARQRRAIRRLLAECQANIPLTAEMTPEQKRAAQRLQDMARAPQPCDREFYNHIMEERRRKAEDHEIRRRMRERDEQRRQEELKKKEEDKKC